MHDRVAMTTIRAADTEDLDAIIDLRLAFLSEVRGPGFAMPDGFDAETRDFFEREAGASRLWTWLAEDDGVAVGVVSILLWPRPPQPEDRRTLEGYIINMYVAPECRRRGIAQRLMDTCVAAGDELGVRKYVLHFTDDAEHLYTSNGFEPKVNWLKRPVDR